MVSLVIRHKFKLRIIPEISHTPVVLESRDGSVRQYLGFEGPTVGPLVKPINLHLSLQLWIWQIIC